MTKRQAGTPGKSSRTKCKATKKAQLIRILTGKAGVDITAISEKLGWQPHTTRAALSGLRKVGYEIAAEKPDGGKPTRYRITFEPEVTDNAG